MRRGRLRLLCSVLSVIIIILLLSGCVPGDGGIPEKGLLVSYGESGMVG